MLNSRRLPHCGLPRSPVSLSNEIRSLMAFVMGLVSTNPCHRGRETDTARYLTHSGTTSCCGRVQLLREVGTVLQRQAPQLNVLSRRDVHHPQIITIRFYGIGEQA